MDRSPARGWRRQLKAGAALAFLLAVLAPAQALALPDNRGWELVSPIDKNGGAPLSPLQVTPGALRASSDGNTVAWASNASFGSDPKGAPPVSQYLSARSSSGWSTQNISPAALSGAYEGDPYLAFSSDLSRALLVNPDRCPTGDPCPEGYQLRDNATGALTSSPADPGLFEGASPNLNHILFLDGDELYRWSPPTAALTLISNAPADGLGQGDNPVSADGTRVYWQGTDTNLYLRNGASTAQVDDAQGGGGTFEAASTDGAVAFFTKANHLYRYVASTDTATDLTPSSGVLELLGASEDGGEVFYRTATAVQRWSSGTTTQVVTAALTGTSPLTAKATADGNRLFFTTTKALIGSDTNNDHDVYQWEANGTGSCTKAAGCTELISSGRAEGGEVFLDASANGDSAFFVGDRSLVSTDPGGFDLYVARVGGGFPDPPVAIPCIGDACQSLPSEPQDPGLSSLFAGPGNPPVRYVKKRAKCPKGSKRVKGKCRHQKGAKGKGSKKGGRAKRGSGR